MRGQRTAKEIADIAEFLSGVVNELRAVSQKMKDSHVEHMLSHGDTPIDRYVPALRKWAHNLNVDLDTHLMAKAGGKQSHIESDKARSENARPRPKRPKGQQPG